MKYKYSILLLIFGFFLLPKLAMAAPSASTLVKLPCSTGAGVNDPCRAVYYVGADGLRHAFPNQRVYFSWYADWNGVVTITATDMAALRLGRNVTYRPGVKLVKFPTVPQTYAVDAGGVLRWVKSEAAAIALYGTNWARTTDDISETFYTDYTFGADINSVSDYNAATVRAGSPTIDSTGGGESYSFQSITTSGDTFNAHVMKLDRNKYQMETLVAGAADCEANCQTKTLAAYAADVGAHYGIHGTYFCPPDYPSCAGEINSYNGPLYDSQTLFMHNAQDIFFHLAPMIAESENGRLVYYSQAPSFNSVQSFATTNGSPLHAAIANYPGLVYNGTVIVESEDRLDNGMRNNKATRGAIGWNGSNYILVIAQNATVIDLANIMQALDADFAMNLDGGGSSALIYAGQYKIGPGRLLPNAIVFTER